MLRKYLNLIGNPIMSLLAFKSKTNNIFLIADLLNDLGWYIGRLQNPNGIHLVVSQIHDDGAAERFIKDLQMIISKLNNTIIKNKMLKLGDEIATNAVKSLGYKSLKKAILGKLNSSSKKSKNRLIYDLKSDLKDPQQQKLLIKAALLCKLSVIPRKWPDIVVAC